MKFLEIELEGEAYDGDEALVVGAWRYVHDTSMVLRRTTVGWEIITDFGDGDQVICQLPDVGERVAERVAVDMFHVLEQAETGEYARGFLVGAESERQKITYGFQVVFGGLLGRR
jgi:hypothetical protein